MKKQKKNIKPIVAVVGGVIAGAIAMKNKKTSDKVSKVLKDLKADATDMSKKVKSKINKSIKKIEIK